MRAVHAFWAVPFLLVGCGGDSSESTGTVDLYITDAPVDSAAEVVVQFDSVELKPADGESVIFDAPGQIELLSLQNGETVPLLEGVTVKAGRYNWMRLHVTDGSAASYIMLDDGSEHPLTIPSADQSGLKLNRGFTVPADGEVDLTIDFDLRKSVHEDGNGYKLRPTLRIVQTEVTGFITGTVSNTYDVDGEGTNVASENCSGAVYVYSGADVVPDDEGSANPPLASGILAMDEEGVYAYTVSFLEAGEYTVALTCDAAADQPDTDDDITFSSTQNVTVTPGDTVPVDF